MIVDRKMMNREKVAYVWAELFCPRCKRWMKWPKKLLHRGSKIYGSSLDHSQEDISNGGVCEGFWEM